MENCAVSPQPPLPLSRCFARCSSLWSIFGNVPLGSKWIDAVWREEPCLMWAWFGTNVFDNDGDWLEEEDSVRKDCLYWSIVSVDGDREERRTSHRCTNMHLRCRMPRSLLHHRWWPSNYHSSSYSSEEARLLRMDNLFLRKIYLIKTLLTKRRKREWIEFSCSVDARRWIPRTSDRCRMSNSECYLRREHLRPVWRNTNLPRSRNVPWCERWSPSAGKGSTLIWNNRFDVHSLPYGYCRNEWM